ncbi:MAG: hypothetical protein SFT90_04750 [Rickettsiales bacterium]|nr:hypothetical protein [Rickettsiales bacterium]
MNKDDKKVGKDGKPNEEYLRQVNPDGEKPTPLYDPYSANEVPAELVKSFGWQKPQPATSQPNSPEPSKT